MFDNMMNFGEMFQQAQEVTGKMREAKSQLQHVRVKGSSGGGMVEVEVTGQLEPVSCRIDESLMTQDNRELLEDMIVVAFKSAMREANVKQQEMMQSMAGGLELPPGLMEQISKFMP
ncbi:MAG: YbaB/EbfC family nucleoid-associated protein [Planctomycetaceae bacterium]|nr:YbaB/EbfC family nucleoid-associated protein [Planctomycetaceae bacterium]